MTSELAAQQISKILIIDRAGNGWSILWSSDGQTWVNHQRNPINAVERDRALDRLRQSAAPDAQERTVVDFNGCIPTDWLVDGARVV